MRDDRFEDDQGYNTFDKPDIMDRIGDSFSSVFSRRSRNNDKADELLSEFTAKEKDDDYELFVDERVERKREFEIQKQERKREKKNKKKKPPSPLMRRVRNIIAYCTIVGVVLVVCVILSLTVLFKTQNYEVTGNTKYDEKEIIETCGIGGSDNIFLANKKAASKRLVKKYPYVEEADVSFAIPDTITIDITEAVPAYVVKLSDSIYYVASSKGRILEQVESPKGYDLPLFLGGELKSNTVGDYIEFADDTTLDIIESIVTVFVDNGYTGITEIDATDTASISFTYDGRIKVKLGVPEDLSYKVRTAMTIINEKLDVHGSSTTEGELDVSSCNETKKSYFRDKSLIDSQNETTAPIDKEEALSESHEDSDGDGFDDMTGEFIEEEETQEETKPPLSPEDWYLD
ncbi:MAG: FtsQ-type POTRA domain-containing protein [Ruminococcaceae bacterium]|nr:FtsQ-type POTRA domain-containing protein [Oscillospiraceae bacterium]